MAVTPTLFKTRFPEFSTETDARVQLFLDDATVVLNVSFWSTKYDLGISYLTAHYLALANKSELGSTGSGGVVTGRAVDGASVNYGTATPLDMSDTYYSSTVYGSRYLALRKSLGVGACVI